MRLLDEQDVGFTMGAATLAVVLGASLVLWFLIVRAGMWLWRVLS
jgi:hypothetical protein